METLNEVFRRLSTAAAKYRSIPFWAWNDKLAPDRLTEQIEMMKHQGFGGFFIHSREGLETKYLSKEWMDSTEAAVEHAEHSAMEVWIYDEDKWPSGSAGGIVSAANPEGYSAKGLTMEVIPYPANSNPGEGSEGLNDREILAIYRVSYDSGSRQLSSFQRLQTLAPVPGSDTAETLIVCRAEVSGPSEWYNGNAPSDNLNPQAVSHFLEKTYQAYADWFSKKFGSVIQGFFTDEPNVCDFFARFSSGRPWLPWSDTLPLHFETKHGYSLFENIPLLFFDGPGSKKARYDYWFTLTELFVDSYTRQIYNWCEDHDLKLTGHMLYENDLGYGVRCNGAVMPHYRYMHAPGVDLLGDQRKEYLTVKQCTSVANQFRREMVVSEMYGCTGWELSFAGQKRLGDWLFVMGVTRRCQHLAHYSITGCRKRDYPPAFNYQSTWWRYSRLLEDYFARLGICTTSGDVYRDILMIHPIGTFWMKSGSSVDEDLSRVYMNMGWLDAHITKLNQEGDYYNQLTEQLLRHQYDFDFGDELIMRDSAKVAGGQLQVGYKLYSHVIVPPVETLMDSTIKLLEKFLGSGGQIFWMSPFPTMMNAVPSDEPAGILQHKNVHRTESITDLLSRLSSMVERPVRICDGTGQERNELLSMSRETASGWICTITNIGTNSLDDVILTFSKRGSLTKLDLFTGKRTGKTVQLIDTEGMRSRTSFEPEETKVFFIDETEEPDTIPELPGYYRHPHDAVDLVYGFPPVSPVELTSENGLTLDYCRIRVFDEPWSEKSPVWIGQKRIRERFGMQAIHYNGVPQRYLWLDDNRKYPVSLRFSFTVDTLPEGDVFAVVEKSQDMNIRCNGKACTQTGGWFIDRDFLKHRIPVLQTGKNTLEIDMMYTTATELEDIYIVGNFGVSPERHIISPPVRLRRGDWTLQGLKHYSGSCIYRFTVPRLGTQIENKRLLLRLGEFRGTLAVVRIKDNEPIYALRETSILIDGMIAPDTETKIEIEIVGNLRNLLGPLHRSANVCSRISWEDFHPSGAAYTPLYTIEPMGLMGEIYLFFEKQAQSLSD